MEEEILQSSELNQITTPITQANVNDFVQNIKWIDPNNVMTPRSQVQDFAVQNPEVVMENPELQGMLGRMDDLQRQYNIINQDMRSAEQKILDTTSGRGITQIGMRNRLATEQRRQEMERNNVLAEIEMLQGNIDTARRYQERANSIADQLNMVDVNEIGSRLNTIEDQQSMTPRQIRRAQRRGGDSEEDQVIKQELMIEIQNEFPEYFQANAQALQEMNLDQANLAYSNLVSGQNAFGRTMSTVGNFINRTGVSMPGLRTGDNRISNPNINLNIFRNQQEEDLPATIR